MKVKGKFPLYDKPLVEFLVKRIQPLGLAIEEYKGSYIDRMEDGEVLVYNIVQVDRRSLKSFFIPATVVAGILTALPDELIIIDPAFSEPLKALVREYEGLTGCEMTVILRNKIVE